MKKLTIQPSPLNLAVFKESDRYDCDDVGNGILHHLVILKAPLFSIKDAITRLKLTPHTFNEDFKTPIDIAIESGQFDVAQFLLEQPIQIESEFLDYMLGTLISEYQRDETQSEVVIGFFASRLCGVDVHSLFNKHIDAYKGHINWFQGTGVSGQSLEGFWMHDFLPLRIRSMLEIFAQLYLSKPSLAQAKETSTHLKEVKAEIKRDLYTLWVERYGRQIEGLTQRAELLKSLVLGIISPISQLTENSSIILYAGWSAHSLYVLIKKTALNQYQLTVHNLGQGCDLHISGAGSKRYPYPIGLLTTSDWNSGGLGFEYVKALIETRFPTKPMSVMQPVVYKKVSVASLSHTAFNLLPEQIVGNCTVANHDSAQNVAMESSVCVWLQTEERKLIGGLVPHKKYTPIPFIKFWPQNIVELYPIKLTYPNELQPIKWSDIKVIKEIGSGNFATVYLGEWQGIEVAIKKLLVPVLPGDISETFTQEAIIHAQCNHHNILRLYGVTKEPGHFALITDYYPRGSLYDALHEPLLPLPWETRWAVSIDIARGLVYLHDEKKILHRDLKSLNVLISHDFRATIADFGQSKIKTHTTSSAYKPKEIKGTVSWRAPETFKAGYKFSTPADIHSAGMVLWEIASREYPFGDESDLSTVKDWIKDGEVEDANPIPNDCPPPFGQVIRDTWQHDASKRPNAADVLKALEAGKKQFHQQVNQLLQHVAYGEQDEAEALIKTNPSLLLGKGTVTDYSERTFTNITPFQFALWALDSHMWRMLTKYLPQPAARDQLRELEAQGTPYGKHYDFNPLFSAYKTYVDNYDPWTAEQLNTHWNTVIGKQQTQVPAHVAQEYCHPDRSFFPTPSFKEPSFPRSFKIGDYTSEVWFPHAAQSYGSLGLNFGVLRGDCSARSLSLPAWQVRGLALVESPRTQLDFSAVAELCKIRTLQYEELKASLH